MLMMIGPVQFDVQPFNITRTARRMGASWVEKPVIGSRPPLEYTGQENDTWRLTANLFPQRFGGLGALTTLKVLQRQGLPHYAMRGDGALLGWVVVENVSERASYLDGTGLGKRIDVTIGLRQASTPLAGSFFQALDGLVDALF